MAGDVSSREKMCVNHADRKAVWFPFANKNSGLCFDCYLTEHEGEIAF